MLLCKFGPTVNPSRFLYGQVINLSRLAERNATTGESALTLCIGGKNGYGYLLDTATSPPPVKSLSRYGTLPARADKFPLAEQPFPSSPLPTSRPRANIPKANQQNPQNGSYKIEIMARQGSRRSLRHFYPRNVRLNKRNGPPRKTHETP